MINAKGFKITSVSRVDLLEAGFTEDEASQVTDDQMERIAARMADAYIQSSFWVDLKYIAKDVIIET